EEVAGKKSIDFVHPDDRENVLEFYRDMEKEPGCSRKKEHRLLHKDGHYVWSEGTITNLLHQDQIRGFVSNFHDITDRKNSERALIESEIRLREIINNEPECVKLLNEKGELLKMNPAGLHMIEADSFEQVKGMSVYSLVDEPYRNDFAEMTGDIFNGQSRQMEFSITGLKGKKRFMETHAVPLKNADGNIIALLAVTRDVTEKKKIEQELLLSEQQYRSFFEQASDAIFVTDFNGVIKDMNLSLCNMFGYSREELLNMNVTDIIDKDQLERQPIVFEKLLAGQHVFSNRKMVRRNGTVIDVEANVKKMSDNRILVIARDVTERNKTQDELSKTSHQLKNIFESLEHSFWGINIEKHEMLYVSPGAKKIYGYPESSFMNNPDFWMEVILPEDRHLVNSIYPFINEGKPAVVHYRIRRADGIPRWLELRITPTLGADGKLVQLDGITIDITDEKKAEQELKISSSLLKATLESTNDGILVVGRNGKITGYNSQFMKMWNISEEVIQKTDDEIAMRQGLKQLKDPESFSRRVKELYESPDEVSFDTFELIDGRTFERYSQPQRMNNEIVGRVWSFRDVTKQKKAEEETKKVANQLTELSASIPGIVYQFKLSADGSMSYPFVSEGVYELSGLTPKEIYENSHVTFSIVHEDDVASLFQSIQTSAQTLQPWFHIFRINDREGNCKWIRGNSIPHQLPDGDIIWNGTMIDITELKTTEEELKSSELRFRSLFEQASDGIFISDPNGNLIDANSIGCQMLGYTREEIMELNLSEIILVLDKEPPLQIDRVNGGENVLMTRTVRRKNGSLFPVEINSKMLADGRILGIVRDITERKKTEEAITEREARYRSVVENIHEALVMDDKDGNLVYVNNEFSNIFGYSKEELKNLNLKDYTSPASYTEVLERHQQRIQGKQVPSEFLYKGMRKDGTERWIEARVSCIVKNGEIIGTQSLERDVTERKHAEEELIKSEQSFIGLFNSSSEAIYI
ncbi:MAG: PAS domain S-box protein, partial [Bacteroidetes bacterium]|nr:PAS domain S-box protein [Bacteroidota bacterium]